MAPQRLKRLAGVIAVAAALGAFTAQAQLFDDGASVLGENVNVSCTQPSLTAVDCDYRIVRPQAVIDVRAQFGEIELPRPEFYPYPIPGSSVSAVFFLIDTSDPRRSAAVTAAVEHIRQILAQAKEHHVFGLGTFDKNLRVLVEPGGSASDIEAALANVRAQGRTTELYRNTLAAVNLVGKFDASRRSVVIFSDGQAEDRAYFHADVINAAREYGVSIDGLGYPRSVALSVALQTLRRMAEDTGGQFVEGTPQFRLPEPYLDAPFTAFDNGGVLAIDLTPAVDAGAADGGTVELSWQLATSSARARVNVKLPAPPPPPASASVLVERVIVPISESATGQTSNTVKSETSTPSKTADSTPLDTGESTPSGIGAAAVQRSLASTAGANTTPSTSTPSKASATESATAQANTTALATGTSSSMETAPASAPTPTTQNPTAPSPKPTLGVPSTSVSLSSNDTLMYMAVALSGVMVILMLVLVRVIKKRRGAPKSLNSEHPAEPTEGGTEQMPVFAFLEAMDGTQQRFPITSAAFRIGRHADNELPLADPSMSRHHAQIQLRRDGDFQINDLDSMNGVFVNEKRVTTAVIKDADIVEFGDVRMRFGIAQGEDALGGDETVMVATSLPSSVSEQKRGAA